MIVYLGGHILSGGGHLYGGCLYGACQSEVVYMEVVCIWRSSI